MTMKKTLTEEEKLRRKERAAARRAKKKEAKAAEAAKEAERKAARKRRAEERKRKKREEKLQERIAFDRKEQRLKNTYIGKNLRNTDLELINYPFYTTSFNSEVKLDVDDNNIIRSVKLMRM